MLSRRSITARVSLRLVFGIVSSFLGGYAHARPHRHEVMPTSRMMEGALSLRRLLRSPSGPGVAGPDSRIGWRVSRAGSVAHRTDRTGHGRRSWPRPRAFGGLTDAGEVGVQLLIEGHYLGSGQLDGDRLAAGDAHLQLAAAVG
ncbi:hypothetical protein GA0070615_6728 [Micromonospora aurantiaca]|nr:hypothetical protein GA0070615_6728 [Micromonospora aurantiaca]